MTQSPNKITQFWQELKRRRVVHVITLYASATFVIIELINNLTEPLNLPSNLATIVIIVLAVGFPLAIILSWIYDLTSEGIEKTKPIEEISKEQRGKVPNAWKIATYISFAVIIGLVTFNIVEGTKGLKPGDIQSLVILPFDNLTGDDQLDYVSEGMHALLIGDVQRIGNLRVIGKTSASAIKNQGISLPEIAKKHNIQAVVEPTLTCYGEMACVQLKVITLYPEEKVLWVEDYMEDKSQMLNLNNRITRKMADEMMIEITPEQERLLSKSRMIDRNAYDEYLRARSSWDAFSRESLYKALDYLNSAIEKEPDWAPLYAGLARVWFGIQQMGMELPSIASPKIYENLNKANELDPDLSDSHYLSHLSGLIAHLMEWNWEKSEREFLKALAINPSDAKSRIFYAQLLMIQQRNDEALAQGQWAMSLDPLNPMMKWWYSSLLLGVGDCKTALSIAEEVVAADPGNIKFNKVYGVIEIAAFLCKDYDKAFEAGKIALLDFNIEEDAINKIDRIYDEQGFAAAYEEKTRFLLEFASNNKISPVLIANNYIWADQPDKAMDWIEMGFEIHDPQMTYIAISLDFAPLFDNPRFIEIVKKMNLPLPED